MTNSLIPKSKPTSLSDFESFATNISTLNDMKYFPLGTCEIVAFLILPKTG